MVLIPIRRLAHSCKHGGVSVDFHRDRDIAHLLGGFHQGKTIFNDKSGLVIFVGVAERKIIAEVARGLAHLFAQRPGVTFLSDVEVMRSDYFTNLRA